MEKTPFYFTDSHVSRGTPIYRNTRGNHNQEIREVVAQNSGLRDLFGTPILDSEGVQEIQSKINEYWNLDFQGWAMNQLDTSTPWAMKTNLSLYPDLFKERLEGIKENSELQKRLAKISIFGPQNTEDLRLVYDVNQRQKTVSNLPIYKFDTSNLNKIDSLVDSSPLFPKTQNNAQFSLSKGIFNPAENTQFKGQSNLYSMFQTALGADPNQSRMSEGRAFLSGLSRFGQTS